MQELNFSVTIAKSYYGQAYLFNALQDTARTAAAMGASRAWAKVRSLDPNSQGSHARAHVHAHAINHGTTMNKPNGHDRTVL